MTAPAFPAASALRERRAELLKVFAIRKRRRQGYYAGISTRRTKTSIAAGSRCSAAASHTRRGSTSALIWFVAQRRCAYGDPLCEATPLPPDGLVPGWREAATRLLPGDGTGRRRADVAGWLAGLGLDEAIFDAAFRDGISTLRLTRYPLREAGDVGPDVPLVEHKGSQRPHDRRASVSIPTGHAARPGRCARACRRKTSAVNGRVPPADGTLAVNFGKLLEQWTGGQVRATLHRVVSPERERFSIPFFYEPAVDAEIAALPLPGVERSNRSCMGISCGMRRRISSNEGHPPPAPAAPQDSLIQPG